METDEWTTVAQKMHLVYPHQDIVERMRSYECPHDREPMKIVFVGGDFFRKGGEGLLEAIERVGDELNVVATIVSRVTSGDLAVPPMSLHEIESIRRRLTTNGRITWVARMDNAQILSLLEECHLGATPTLQDTFNYFALELMALGVPSLVTNVDALPEFTGSDTGFVVDLPTNELGAWVGVSATPRERLSMYREATESLALQICDVLRGIREKPDQLLSLHESSLKRVRTQFDPVARQAKMLEIYRTALDR